MNNLQPKLTFVYNRRKTASPTRKAAVELRISYNYKQKHISTGIMLYPNQWRKGLIVNCPDALQLCQVINKLLSDVRQILLEMLQQGDVNLALVPKKLKELNNKKVSFLEFCCQRAKVRKYGKTSDSKQRYDRFIRLFTEYGKILSFEDITEKNIIAYDEYLNSTGMKPYSKWNNYHRFLNSFISDAIDAGYLRKNPYKWIAIDRDKASHSLSRCLTPEEFHKLKNTPMPTECLERVKDLFIFQTYTCLRYSDLASFDTSYIQNIKGMKVYTRNSKKTKKPFTIPLLSEALEILDKYKGHLPIISNVKYNLYLKAIAQTAGINKRLSSHWARHTGATLLLNEGVGMQIVSKICGHTSIKITEQIYAKLLDETVVDAIKEKLPYSSRTREKKKTRN